MIADEIRAAMSVDPRLLHLADALREKFGARLVWLKTAHIEVGKRPSEPTDMGADPIGRTAQDDEEQYAAAVPCPSRSKAGS